MICFTTSPDVITGYAGGTDLCDALVQLTCEDVPVFVCSNHAKPHWFDGTFPVGKVHHIHYRPRQDGQIIQTAAKTCDIEPYDVLVLAANKTDVAMGKNGKAILIAAGWSTDPRVTGLGIQVATPNELLEVSRLTNAWHGGWWWSADRPLYNIRALADLSTYYVQVDQETFGKKVKATVKGGGSRLNALLTVTARSLLQENIIDGPDLLWGVYPSSSSKNDDTDVLSDFAHRLRTTVSQVQMARKGKPLFIRHTVSVKRSGGGAINRMDPTSQIQTLHLNPEYRGKLNGRHVVVVDDCTTYGTSFGVASAFLHAAGAGKITTVALGKFGNQTHYYDISINSDPFASVVAGGFSCNSYGLVHGAANTAAQTDLRNLIP